MCTFNSTDTCYCNLLQTQQNDLFFLTSAHLTWSHMQRAVWKYSYHLTWAMDDSVIMSVNSWRNTCNLVAPESAPHEHFTKWLHVDLRSNKDSWHLWYLWPLSVNLAMERSTILAKSSDAMSAKKVSNHWDEEWRPLVTKKSDWVIFCSKFCTWSCPTLTVLQKNEDLLKKIYFLKQRLLS